MDIGIQTKGIVPAHGIENGFAQIAAVGFQRVDINIDLFLKNNEVYSGNKGNGFFDSSLEDLVLYFQQYVVAMEKYGIRPSQMHAPYPVWVPGKPQMTEYMHATVIPKSIVIAEALQVPWMVIHPFKMQFLSDKSPEEERRRNIEYFKVLVPLLKQCNVKVCLENLYENYANRLVEGTCANPKEVLYYLDELNTYAGEELFGICLDTGHLQLVHRDPYDYITQLGSHLKILHLHENEGVNDLHHMPFTFGRRAGEGQDWQRIFEALAKIDFDGTISFETFPCVSSFPRGCEEEVLRTIYQIGCYFKDEIDKEKEKCLA